MEICAVIGKSPCGPKTSSVPATNEPKHIAQTIMSKSLDGFTMTDIAIDI
jgi:hypothetical protein